VGKIILKYNNRHIDRSENLEVHYRHLYVHQVLEAILFLCAKKTRIYLDPKSIDDLLQQIHHYLEPFQHLDEVFAVNLRALYNDPLPICSALPKLPSK